MEIYLGLRVGLNLKLDFVGQITHCRGNKRIPRCPKCICPKMFVIAQLAFELVYSDFTHEYITHYATKIQRVRIIILKTIFLLYGQLSQKKFCA